MCLSHISHLELAVTMDYNLRLEENWLSLVKLGIILSQVSVLHLSFPSSSYRKVINSDGFKGSLSIKSLIKCSVCSLIHVRH